MHASLRHAWTSPTSTVPSPLRPLLATLVTLSLLPAVAFANTGGDPGPSPDDPLPLEACGAQPIVPDPIQWQSLGPTSANDGQGWTGDVKVTGRINGVEANPHAPANDVWVTTAGGGVWHLERGEVEGAPYHQWTPMTDDAEFLATGALALDSCDATRCHTIWAGMGENSLRRDTQYGGGVLRGRWNPALGRYVWDQLGAELFRYGSIAALVLDPSTPDNGNKVVYIALTSGKTANAAHATLTTTPAGTYGIYKSIDAGESWALVHQVEGRIATDLEIDPVTPNVLYAGYTKRGLWRSQDSGATWEAINFGIPASYVNAATWPEMAIHRTAIGQDARLYAVLEDAPGCPHPHAAKTFNKVGFCKPGVFRSDDGGDTWEMTEAAQPNPHATSYGSPLSSYTSFTHALTIHPTDPDTVWYGGTMLFRSDEKGENWYRVEVLYLHPDHHDVYVFEDPESPSGITVYDVNDGGFFVGDGDKNWSDHLQDGLVITQFQSISTTHFGNTMIGGTQDNGVLMYSGGPVWDHLMTGDSASTVMDSDTWTNVYDVQVGNEPRRCNQGVAGCNDDWELITSGIDVSKFVSWYPPMVEGIAAWAGQHPLFFANGRLHRSLNDGETWKAITPWTLPYEPLTTQPFFEEIDSGNVITAIGKAHSDDETIYIGYYDGRIFVSHDVSSANPSWTRIDTSWLPDRPITSIAVHPLDRDQVYLSFEGFGDHSIWRTDDGGASWLPWDEAIDASAVVAERPANRLQIEPLPPFRVWLGTDNCVYSRLAGKSTPGWTYNGEGLPNVAVYDFAIDGEEARIVAASHGRGIWTRPIAGAPVLTKPFNKAWCCAFWIDQGDPPGPPLHELRPTLAFAATTLPPEATCEMALIDEAGEVCTTSELDARGASLRTDAMGALVTDLDGFYRGRPMASACFDGLCAGGVEATTCAVDAVELSCGGVSTVIQAAAPVSTRSPSSAALSLVPAAAPPAGAAALRPTAKATTGTTVTVAPTLAQPAAASEILCRVDTTVAPGDDPVDALRRVADAIAADRTCSAAGVVASVVGLEMGTGEDPAPPRPRLVLRASDAEGTQLVPAVVAGHGVSVALDDLGLLAQHQPVAPRLTLQVPREGAKGGSVRAEAIGPFGRCALTVPTVEGDSAATVAQRIEDAFQAPPDPELAGSCPAHRNPRDATRRGASLQFPLSRGLVVEVSDAGLTARLDVE